RPGDRNPARLDPRGRWILVPLGFLSNLYISPSISHNSAGSQLDSRRTKADNLPCRLGQTGSAGEIERDSLPGIHRKESSGDIRSPLGCHHDGRAAPAVSGRERSQCSRQGAGGGRRWGPASWPCSSPPLLTPWPRAGSACPTATASTHRPVRSGPPGRSTPAVTPTPTR